MIYRILFLVSLAFILNCKYISVNPATNLKAPKYSGNLPLQQIKLPPGFEIDVYAENITNARSMTLSPSGILFVGTRSAGNVYAIVDIDQDHRADTVYTIASNLNMPNGVAYRDGHLYVAEVSRILKFENIESNLGSAVAPKVVFDKYPDKEWHGWKYIAFGPDDKLYVPVGAPCNVCDEENEIFASITRINPDGSDFEIVQHGIRNTVGFTWHPDTDELWFTDNGRDWMGDDAPECELNYAPQDGMHFGFPYCHQGDIPDKDFGKLHSCAEFTPPALKLGPHVAPLGLEFYTGTMFPPEFKNRILIAQHGSWNRSEPIGYRVMQVVFNGKDIIEHSAFAEGWLQGGKAWGRPVDIEIMQDGSVLVSDDYAHVIYRITYAQ